MLSKKTIFFLTFVIAISSSWAQQTNFDRVMSKIFTKCPINIGFGAHAYNFSHVAPITQNEYNGLRVAPSLLVALRYNFLKMGDNAALSFGLSPAASYLKWGKAYGVDSLKSSWFGLQVPLTLNATFGRGSTGNSNKKWGIFLGGGGSLNTHMITFANKNDAFKASSAHFGLYANAGFVMNPNGDGVFWGFMPSFSMYKDQWNAAVHLVMGLNYGGGGR